MAAAAVTRSRLAADLRALGVRERGVLMVHTAMSALGWVAGGSEVVVRALQDALGPGGTLAAYAGWEELSDDADAWSAAHRAAYAAEPPVFDPATAEAVREHGRIPERIRTWPGAVASDHPEARVVAVGPRAAWLCGSGGPVDGYGAASPFARLVAAEGQVLLLGAPLDSVTLVHHAEALARAPGRRVVRSTVPVLDAGGQLVLRSFEDHDTSGAAFPYATLGLAEDEIAVIGRAALAAGTGRRGRVGDGDRESHLFDAAALTAFAVAWIEARFGGGGSG